MTNRLPSLKPKEVVRAFEKAGWRIHRQKGSHLVMRKIGHPKIIVIPMHGEDMPKGTLRGILADADLSVEEFVALLMA